MQNPHDSRALRVVSRLVLSAFAALGATQAFAQTDPPLTDYRAKVLMRGLSNPTSMAFRPDGRVYITRKNGVIRLLDPVTGDTSTAATLATANVREDGLHSLVLDPGFASNHWVYVLMSERSPGDTAIVVARYATDPASGALLTGTRVTLLKVPVALNSTTAEHNTGTLAFGPEGNLYVALADNTQHFYGSVTGSGYAPRDTARPIYDAQRTAANTNDLRGKILRIRPEADGTYSIPPGNLRDSINRPSFNPNWNGSQDSLSKVRPEIFLMGLRHPFRISVDPVTGWLYWAEPGPNASADNASQGPRGYDVVGMAKGPGNYGWPYCRGNPYVIQKPSSITTPYFCYTEYNGALNSPAKLPKAFDRHVFIVEWHRSLIFVGKLDDTGAVQSIRSFWNARDSVSNGPIDLKTGPDGALYLLNWVGNSYTNNSGNGTLTRLEYTGVQVGVSRGDEPRAPALGGSLYVFGPGSAFRVPAGKSSAEFYGLRGEKLWSFRRSDASRAESVRLPEGVRGAVRVRVR